MGDPFRVPETYREDKLRPPAQAKVPKGPARVERRADGQRVARAPSAVVISAMSGLLVAGCGRSRRRTTTTGEELRCWLRGDRRFDVCAVDVRPADDAPRCRGFDDPGDDGPRVGVPRCIGVSWRSSCLTTSKAGPDRELSPSRFELLDPTPRRPSRFELLDPTPRRPSRHRDPTGAIATPAREVARPRSPRGREGKFMTPHVRRTARELCNDRK